MTTYTKPTGPVLVIVASLLGLGVSLYNYLVPLTGVTGTEGALLVVVSSLLLMLGGIILLKARTGILATTVRILALLGALGTIVAAWFLHEFWLVAATVIALLGVIVDFVSAKGDRK